MAHAFFDSRAMASRNLSVTSKVASVRQSAGGAEAGAGSVTVTLFNLSNVTQTVTVTVQDEVVSNSLNIGNPSGISGWTTGGASYIFYDTWRPPKVVSTPVILASQSGTAIAIGGFYCNWNLNGCKCVRSFGGFTFNMNSTNPSGPNYVKVAAVTYSFRLSFTVAEDRGALLASGFGQADLAISTSVTPSYAPINFDVNGGRPF